MAMMERIEDRGGREERDGADGRRMGRMRMLR
jgi:hypothetical protein